MKRKIKVIDLDGNITEKEYSVRQEKQYRALLKFPNKVFKNRKAYTRKTKYKSKNDLYF